MTQMKPIQIVKLLDLLAIVRKSLNKKGFDIKAKSILNQ